MGCPPSAYFEAAYPGFAHPAAKLGTTFAPLGTRAGTLTAELRATARAARARSRSRSATSTRSCRCPGAGVEQPGTFVTVIGTSICDMVLGPDEVRLPGITGVARDGILPGLYGYEAGQAAVGDMLAWFVRTLDAPAETYERPRAGRRRASGRARPDCWRSTGSTATARSSPTPT